MGSCSNSTVRRVVAIASNSLSWLASRISRRFLRTFVSGYTYGSILAVEKLIHGAAHLFQGHITLDIPLKDIFGFRRWLKPLHAHAGKRVLNFSFALYPRLIQGRYCHPGKPLKYILFQQLTGLLSSRKSVLPPARVVVLPTFVSPLRSRRYDSGAGCHRCLPCAALRSSEGGLQP